jgi:hypothetical protein
MKKLSILGPLILSLVACALPPRTEKAAYASDSNAKELSLRLEQMARLCWQRDWGWFGDGVRIESRRLIEGHYLVEAQRFAPDIGLRPPFIEIIVSEVGEKSRVQVFEAGYNVFSGVDTLEPEVRSWVDGSSNCMVEK